MRKKPRRSRRSTGFEQLEARHLLASDGMPLFNVIDEPNTCPVEECSVDWIYMHSGEFTETVTDLSIPGRGFDWEFTRTYRSGVTFDGRLGFNWDFADNKRLMVVSASNLDVASASFGIQSSDVKIGDVVRLNGTGRADLYRRQPDETFTAPVGWFTQLIVDDDGSFVERDAAGNKTFFGPPDEDSGVACMTSRADRNGNRMEYLYDEDGRLETVIDTLGRPIEYDFGDDGRLREIRDFFNRSVKFSYNDQGDLVSVISPTVTGTPNGNDFPNGKETRYGYASGFDDEILNHNLTMIVAPNEVASGQNVPRLQVTYESEPGSPYLDRVLDLSAGGTNVNGVPAGGRYSFEYETRGPVGANDFESVAAKTNVVDRNGNRKSYGFNQLGNFVSVSEFSNREFRAGDPDVFEYTYTYNGDEQRLSDSFPAGNATQRILDQQNAQRFQQGNVVEVIESPDEVRGGDQMAIRTRFRYEPVCNQLYQWVEPRGLDPDYQPQNGGDASAQRYATTYTYDYQEGTNYSALATELAVSETTVIEILEAAGIPMGLGDVNGDGRTDQTAGNVIRRESPQVQHVNGSLQAMVEGSPLQTIVELLRYNDFGQLVSTTDPERNVSVFEYFSESDPNGDGQIDFADGDAQTGGYLKRVIRDAESEAQRNSQTDPTPAVIVNSYEYDPVGNVTRHVDGRGVATDYFVNELNQVVQATRAAAVGLEAGGDREPLPLQAFQFTQLRSYDANDNLIRRQVEDRGNTSNVLSLPLSLDDPRLLAGDSNLDGQFGSDDLVVVFQGGEYEDGVAGNSTFTEGDWNDDLEFDSGDLVTAFQLGHYESGTYAAAFVDYEYLYDILDNPIEERWEVVAGQSPVVLSTRYRYDANENTVLTIFPEGNANASTYDERDLLFQSIRGTRVPPPSVHLAQTDPTDYDIRGGIPCQCNTFHYDENENVIETVDSGDTDESELNNSRREGLGDRTRYVYDGYDRLTSVIDSVGNQVVYQYDPAGHQVRELHFGAAGGASPLADGVDPRPVSLLGSVASANLVNRNLLSATEYLFDELGREFQVDQLLFVDEARTSRAPNVADGAADLGKGSLTPSDNHSVPGLAIANLVGRVTERTEYDKKSRTTFIVEDDEDVHRVFYDGADRPIRRVDPESNQVETAYDDNDNIIEILETDASQIAGVADELFLTTTFFDSLNRPQQVTDNIGQTTYHRYDSRDNLVSTADAQGPLYGSTIDRRAFDAGSTTINSINDFGNVRRYDYDGLNRQLRDEVFLTRKGQGDGVHLGATLEGIKDQSDEDGSFPPEVDAAQGGGDGIIRAETTWDSNTLESALIDDQGNITVFLYDNLDRRVAESKGINTTTPLSAATILRFPNEIPAIGGNAGDVSFIPGSQIDLQLSAAENRIQTVAHLYPSLADAPPSPTTIVFGLDQDGNLRSTIDENGTGVDYDYDALNRRTSATISPADGVAGTTQLAWEYDGLSRLTLAADDNGTVLESTITFAYDSLTRVIEETQQIGFDSTPHVVSTHWRADDLRSAIVYPNDRVVEFTFDGLDRIQLIQDTDAAAILADYDYIGADRVLERKHGNGSRLSYLSDDRSADVGYDGIRHVVGLRHLRADNSLIVGFEHSYDRMDNKLTEAKLHDVRNNEVYGYDSAYRLIRFDRPQQGSVSPEYSTFQLDGVGNWPRVDGETREHSTFNEIIQRDGTTLTYDNNGNLLADDRFRYQWDFANRLRRVERIADDSIVADYFYDAVGRRIRKQLPNPTQSTDYLYDGSRVIEERDSEVNLLRQFIYGSYIDEILILDRNLDGDDSAVGPADQRLHYHQNSLYSVFALTNDVAQILEAYQYDVYGQTMLVSEFGRGDVVMLEGSSLDNPYLFTGRRFDAETDFYYYRARYYEPKLGRFLSRDAIRSANLYEYVGSQPTGHVDPLGLAKVTARKTQQVAYRATTFNLVSVARTLGRAPTRTIIKDESLGLVIARLTGFYKVQAGGVRRFIKVTTRDESALRAVGGWNVAHGSKIVRESPYAISACDECVAAKFEFHVRVSEDVPVVGKAVQKWLKTKSGKAFEVTRTRSISVKKRVAQIDVFMELIVCTDGSIVKSFDKIKSQLSATGSKGTSGTVRRILYLK